MQLNPSFPKVLLRNASPIRRAVPGAKARALYQSACGLLAEPLPPGPTLCPADDSVFYKVSFYDKLSAAPSATLAVSASECRLMGFAKVDVLTTDPPSLFLPHTILLQASSMEPRLYQPFARALASAAGIPQSQLWY